MESLGMSPGALPPGGVWFSSWYVVSIDTGHIAQSLQSHPRWSPAFKMEPVLSVSSFMWGHKRVGHDLATKQQSSAYMLRSLSMGWKSVLVDKNHTIYLKLFPVD